MKLPPLERAVIEVNGACNYSCAMCPQPDRPREFLKPMDLDLFRDIVMQCAQAGVRVINLDGSGEATANRKLPLYIEAVKAAGAKAFIFSNGHRFQGGFMQACIEAGLDYFRFSVIGFDRHSYREWMGHDRFHEIRHNAERAMAYVERSGADCRIASYHLILDPSRESEEVAAYRENWIEPLGIDAEVWRMHNWSGVYADAPERKGPRRSCGRPFFPDIVVRAGGQVHPCCQVLGRDAEAVLGTVGQDGATLADIWHGPLYEDLRRRHRDGDWPSYCRGCDFLIDDPEVLVWTNYGREVDLMHGTTLSLGPLR